MTQLAFSVSGAAGAHGTHGRHGSRGTGRGGDGLAGQNAGIAEAGRASGNIHISLQTFRGVTQIDEILIKTDLTEPSGRQRSFDQRVHADELGAIQLWTVGGRGGDGGRGGNGGGGGRGRSGSDATRSRRGGNGGRGGDGGDGGAGSDGASGGVGGRIEIRLDEADTYTLMAVAHTESPAPLVAGGLGGDRGGHGVGGPGGPGGPGGSSYSWTETEWRTESHTDQHGHSRTRRVSHIRSHSNSGGSRGPSGSRGWTPTSALRAGVAGRPGTFVIQVVEATGVRSYASRYDLALVDFELAESDLLGSENIDNITEFGEVVWAQNLRFRNVGGMPTPSRQRVRVTLNPGDWLIPLDDELFIEESLAPGDEITLPGKLAFLIRDAQIETPEEPAVVLEAVAPRADQLGYEPADGPAREAAFIRAYQGISFTRTVTAQFPIENREGIVAIRSLGAGEMTQISFDVGNISATDIGSESPRRRRVGVQVELLDSDVDASQVTYLNDAGQEADLSQTTPSFNGYFEQILRIEPQRSVRVSGRFGFNASVAAYSGAKLRYSLWIQHVRNPEEWTLVQRREAILRLEPAYRYDPDAKILLVTHNNTTLEAFRAWSELVNEHLGLPSNYWSISRYGHFDQEVELDDGTNLAVHLEDRVIVVLNQPFNPRSTAETDLPTDYLRGADVRLGATRRNTHVVVVGSDQFNMKQLLEPSADVRSDGQDYDSVKRFLEKEVRTGGPLTQETFRDDLTRNWDRVKMHNWTLPFARPKRRHLTRSTRRLQSRLDDMHPNRRYLLVEEPQAPVRAGRKWLIFPRWEVGANQVRRTLNIDTSSAVVLETDDDQLSDPNFINGPPVRFAILLALPFDNKLDRLDWLLQNDRALSDDQLVTADALVRAILVDLSEEQTALRRREDRLDPEVLTQKLASFEALCRFPLHSHIKVDSNKWTLLVTLIAGLKTIAKANKPWWALLGRNRKITRYTIDRLEQFVADILESHVLDPDGEIAMDREKGWERIDQRVSDMLTQVDSLRRSAREEGDRLSGPEAARIVFESPGGLAENIQRDIDVWLNPKDRIWSLGDLERARANETERAAKQSALRELNEDVRGEMLSESEAFGNSARSENPVSAAIDARVAENAEVDN